MTSKQKDLTKNFFALGHHVLAVRALHGADHLTGSTPSSRPGRSSPRPTSGRSRPATRSARRPRSSTPTTGCKPAQLRPGHVSQHHRQRGDGARLRWPPRKLADRPLFYGSLPDHPGQRHPPPAVGLQVVRGQDLPGGGRDRGHRRGHRRVATAGRMGMTASVRPGHRAQVGGDGPRGHGRAAARRRRRPARRPVDRHAHQERAGRPAPGDVRAQRRLAAADRRPGDARRVLRPGHRGVAPRAQVHDAGRLPVRRVPGHRLRAVAHPGARRTCPTSRVANADRPGDVPPVPARPGHAGPAVGRPGHPGSRAPHRRPGEGRHHRQRQLRPGQPPPDADCCGRPRWPASPTTSRRSRCSARPRATC